MDAEPYLSVCIDEVYENYRNTYCKLAKQQGNNYGKWGEELTRRVLQRYQEFVRKQNVAYGKPDLQTSIENQRLIRKANSEQNARINKTVREKKFLFINVPKADNEIWKTSCSYSIHKKG